MDKEQVKALSFEEALTKLEELVEQIDSGDLPLAEALATFKLATELSRHCETLLKDAETAIEQIDAEDVVEDISGDVMAGGLFDMDKSEDPSDTDEPDS